MVEPRDSRTGLAGGPGEPETGLPDIAWLERATLAAIPAPLQLFDGPLLLRAFAGGTGRANAACTWFPGTDPCLADRVARIEARYRQIGLPARFRTTPLDAPELDAVLDARGYSVSETSLVMAGGLGFAAADPAVEFLDAPSDDWMTVLATAEHQGPARREEKLRGASLLLVPGTWLLLRVAGQPAACAHLVLDGALTGIFDVAVAPDYRRRGLARQVLAAGAVWARERGARYAWLQVSEANAPAVTLYRALGLRTAYRYRYRLLA